MFLQQPTPQVQRTVEYGRQVFSQNEPTSFKCAGCLHRASTSPLFSLSHPGRLFRLGCGHIYCTGCLTENQHAKHDTTQAIPCPACTTPAGFPQLNQPTFKLGAPIPCSLTNLTSIRAINILDPLSIHYRARNLYIMDRIEFRAVLSLVYSLTYVPTTERAPFNLPSSTVLRVLSNHGADGLVLNTPELTETELKIVFNGIIFDYLVRQPGSRYHGLLSFLEGGDEGRKFAMQVSAVKSAKRMHVYLRDLEKRWDEVIRWSVSILAVKWWERFE